MERNEPQIEIRAAEPGDAASIASVLRDAFAEYEPLYTSEGLAATTPGIDRIQGRTNEGPTWVALLGGTVVGTVSAVPRGDSLYVRSMAVLPAARGHRIGDLLLERVESFARAHGHKRLFLSTTPFLDRAIRLYERWGFRRTNEGPQELFGTPLFTMEKTLEAPEAGS